MSSDASQVSGLTTPSGIASTAPRTTGYRGNKKKNKVGNSVVSNLVPKKMINHNFKGNTTEMNGHVFQLFSESGNEKQFQRTLEVLGEYIKKNCDHCEDVLCLTKNSTKPLVKALDPPDDAATKIELDMWMIQYKENLLRQKTLLKSLKTIHAVIWGQCSLAMQGKLKSMTGYEAADDTTDCVWLLANIKGAAFSFDDEKYLFSSLDDCLEKFITYRQEDGDDLLAYLASFKVLYEVYEHYGGVFTGGDVVMSALPASGIGLSDKEKSAAVRDRFLAFAFIKRCDPKQYGVYVADLANDYSRGTWEYQATLQGAYKLLNSYNPPPTLFQHKQHTPSVISSQSVVQPSVTTVANPSSEVTFAQAVVGPVAGSDGITRPKISCNKCNHHGHFPDKCPTESGVQMLHTGSDQVVHFSFLQNVATSFSQIHRDVIPAQWILLDSQSTISVFRNAQYLHNIRNSDTKMTVLTNGGSQESTLIGDVTNFGTVWYNPHSLANILSLAEVRKTYRVTMDTDVEPAMCVHRKNGSLMKFVEYGNGLYFHDPSTAENRYTFVTSVDTNKSMFTPREVANADAAIALHRIGSLVARLNCLLRKYSVTV